ncbi:MAG: hypothetical protein HYY22_04145 [Thaumarchaeota archaeon]|nr:hypothetical protein [Nitrososphaerota archaeon]
MADEAAISKLIAFDMDGTLLKGLVIYSLGQRFGFTSKIEDITKSSRIAHERSRRIAKLLRGIRISEFIEIVRAIPLTKGVTQTVRHLQAENYIRGNQLQIHPGDRHTDKQVKAGFPSSQ